MVMILHIVGAYYDRRKEECGLCDGYHSSLSGCHKCADAEEEEDRREAEEEEDALLASGECRLCQKTPDVVLYHSGDGWDRRQILLCKECNEKRKTRRSIWGTGGKYKNIVDENGEVWEEADENRVWQSFESEIVEKDQVDEKFRSIVAEAKAAGCEWIQVEIESWCDTEYRTIDARTMRVISSI